MSGISGILTPSRIWTLTTSPPRCLLHFVLCVCVLAALAPARAQGASKESLTALFNQANTRYQDGDFGAAEQLYRQLVDKGVDSGALYYNLGDACFKQKKLGEAIYYWEKAQRRLPGDADVRENLDLARLMVVDRVDVPPDPLPLRWLDSAVHGLTINQDCLLSLVLFVLTNVLISAYLLARTRRAVLRAFMLALAAGFCFVLFAGALTWRVIENSTRREAVVVEQKAEVRSGPGNDNITVFTVHEGILVRVRGETGGWYQVSLPNGWSGWLEKGVVRLLN